MILNINWLKQLNMKARQSKKANKLFSSYKKGREILRKIYYVSDENRDDRGR